jgi:hypothetical protein
MGVIKSGTSYASESHLWQSVKNLEEWRRQPARSGMWVDCSGSSSQINDTLRESLFRTRVAKEWS